MHDIFKDALKGIQAYNRELASQAPAPKTLGEFQAQQARVELMLDTHIARVKLENRVAELEAILARIAQRLKGRSAQ